MRDINKVIIVGRLTRDAELSYTPAGFSLLKFSIAVNSSKKQGDSYVDEVSFFDVTVFGKQGEAIAQYMEKGKQVAVEGRLNQDRWEKDGQKRSKVAINADNVQLLGASDGVNRGSAPQLSSNTGQVKKVFQDDIPAGQLLDPPF